VANANISSTNDGPAEATPAHRLRQDHIEIFARLGIGPKLLERAGITSVTDQEARTKYGINGPGDRTGIVFPYCDPLTGVRHTARLRRDLPDLENGKPKKKYLCPYGDRRHLYFVPGCGEHVKNPDIPILLVEAEKSALATTAWADRTSRQQQYGRAASKGGVVATTPQATC
jgi:hypothetical protein